MVNAFRTVFFSILYFMGITHFPLKSILVAASTAETADTPTVPNSHFFFLSVVVIYGFKSSVPGIVHAFV